MEASSSGVRFTQIIQGLSLRPRIGFFGYSSVTLVQDGSENILFDTGGYGVRAVLAKILDGIPIHKVFLSHLHFDHCANISIFKDAQIYIHEKELESLGDPNSVYADINNFIAGTVEKTRLVPFSGSRQISEHTQTIPTPGHTAGHSSLEILSQGKKTIIAGDAIETYQEYLDPNYSAEVSDKTSYLNSKNLIKDNYRIIVPGHAPIIEDGVLKDAVFSLKTF